MMTNIELANKLKKIAKNYKTLYVMGCFGAPMTATNKKRYTQNHSYNKQATRTAMINARNTAYSILMTRNPTNRMIPTIPMILNCARKYPPNA